MASTAERKSRVPARYAPALAGRGRRSRESRAREAFHWPSGEVGRRRGASWAGPFPTAPSRTRHARFPGTGLSSDYTVEVAVGRPAWMLSWQEAQATRVLRFRFAMICTQAG